MQILTISSRVLILVVGVAVLVAFSVYNFMGSSSPGVKNAGVKVTPTETNLSSLNQTSGTPQGNQTSHSTPGNASSVTLSVYENRDMFENYYSIEFPSDTTVIHGSKPGNLVASKEGVVFMSRLEDIPDDTTVQLHIITHDEPELKASLKDYSQVSFNQSTIGKNRAWSLVYTWQNGTAEMESSRTYVEGQDQAMVIECTTPSQEFGKSDAIRNAVTESFQWMT